MCLARNLVAGARELPLVNRRNGSISTLEETRYPFRQYHESQVRLRRVRRNTFR
jgi:hypothetical protein